MSVHKAEHMQVIEKNGMDIPYSCSAVTVTSQEIVRCLCFQINRLLSISKHLSYTCIIVLPHVRVQAAK